MEMKIKTQEENYYEDQEDLKLLDKEKTYNDIEKNVVNCKLKVPQFLIKQRGILFKTKGFFFCCKSKFSSLGRITQEELSAYYKLKNLAVIPYCEKNADHEETLKKLYLNTLNIEITKNLESAEWKSIGFQSNNPRTDFRAAGFISLLFLNFFVENYKSEFEKMNNVDCFLTAVGAIRLTKEDDYSYLIKQYKIRKISITDFRNFMKQQSKDENFLFELLSKCFVSAKSRFLKLYDHNLGMRNILFLDSSIDEAFKNVFFSNLAISAK